MANMANAGIVISGLIDGTTVVYSVQSVDATGKGTPLVQHYNESVIDPDWDNIYKHGTSADKQKLPRVIIKANDSSTQQVLDGSLHIVTVKYNGYVVQFGDDGISDNIMPGVLKKETVTLGGVTRDCVTFIGNPGAGDPGTHTDQMELDGYVTTDSGQIDFHGLLIPIEIFEVTSADEGFSAVIWTPEGDQNIMLAGGGTKRTVSLYKGVSEVTDGSNYAVKWVDITGATEVPLVNGQGGITITTSDASKPTGDTIAYDFSDPFQIRWLVKESSSGTAVEVECERGQFPRFEMRKNWTRYFYPKVYNSEGDVADNKVTWTFNFDDALDGTTISGISTYPNYFVISYTDVVTSQGRRSIIAHAQANITL